MRLFPNRKSKPSPRWTFFTWYDIVIDGEVYLTRFNILQTPWFGIKLHWIHKPDPDRGLHDHPWSFLSFVLRGWYKELECKLPDMRQAWIEADCREDADRRFPIRERLIRWLNYKDTISAHRITEVSGNVLTLVITGQRSKSWGFYDDHGNYVDWKNYKKS